MTLTEIAKAIDGHLTRWEKDPALNRAEVGRFGATGHTRFFHPSAYRAGAYVGVKYISYQSAWNLTRAEAEAYLKRIEAGFVGPHFIKETA